MSEYKIGYWTDRLKRKSYNSFFPQFCPYRRSVLFGQLSCNTSCAMFESVELEHKKIAILHCCKRTIPIEEPIEE